MFLQRKYLLLIAPLFLLLVLNACGSNSGPGTSQQQQEQHQVVLSDCKDSHPTVSVTAPAPIAAQRSLYFAGGGSLYAVNADDGEPRWCIRASITGSFPCPHSCPPPPFMLFGQPAVVNGVVYACASGYGFYTYAFDAGNGKLLWRAITDCGSVSIPFDDYAVPIITNGIVYSGSYALRSHDGKILWHTPIDIATEGNLSLQALVHNVIFANTENDIYALDASNGRILWRFAPPNNMPIGGPLVVASNILFVGTLSSVNQPNASMFYALNAVNGHILWQYAMGDYQGAAVSDNSVYVSSRGQYLYALDSSSGSLQWRRQFVYPVYNMARAAGATLYINIDGAYALHASDGSALWHKSLGDSQSVVFNPSSISGSVDYLASIDGQGRSTLYALNAASGAEYWRATNLPQLTPATID